MTCDYFVNVRSAPPPKAVCPNAMKRQRTTQLENDGVDKSSSAAVSFKAVWKYIRHNDSLSLPQLNTLGRELTRLTTKANNTLIQNFPADMWLQIFPSVPSLEMRIRPGRNSWSANDFRHWLGRRTVCKTWHTCIGKLDFSLHIPQLEELHQAGMLIPHVLARFSFSSAKLSGGIRICGLSPLTRLQCLHLDSSNLRANLYPELSKLTQLVELGVIGPHIQPHVFLPLTNLQSLVLTGAEQVTDISPLTNLTSLTLHVPTSLTQESLQPMNLTRLEANSPSFFQSGKGVCKTTKWHYEGEWLNGLRHGHGFCKYTEKNSSDEGAEYEGQWAHGKEHGYGVIRYWNRNKSRFDGSYAGDWIQGKQTGKCTMLFRSGESFIGDVVDGWRTRGTYKFRTGEVYEGEWNTPTPSYENRDVISGRGKVLYPNGDTYEGMFDEGYRGLSDTGNATPDNPWRGGYGVFTFRGTKIPPEELAGYWDGEGEFLWENSGRPLDYDLDLRYSRVTQWLCMKDYKGNEVDEHESSEEEIPVKEYYHPDSSPSSTSREDEESGESGEGHHEQQGSDDEMSAEEPSDN